MITIDATTWLDPLDKQSPFFPKVVIVWHNMDTQRSCLATEDYQLRAGKENKTHKNLMANIDCDFIANYFGQQSTMYFNDKECHTPIKSSG